MSESEAVKGLLLMRGTLRLRVDVVVVVEIERGERGSEDSDEAALMASPCGQLPCT